MHKANAAGKLDWELEYAFKKHFDMDDLSPASFEALHGRMAMPNSSSWDRYRGQGDGSLYCKSCKEDSLPHLLPWALFRLILAFHCVFGQIQRTNRFAEVNALWLPAVEGDSAPTELLGSGLVRFDHG